MLKRSRITVMSIITFIVIICYVFQLMQYQVTDGESYKTISSKSSLGKIDIIAPRGEILDRYGRILATNTIGYSIILERSYFPSSKDIKKQNDELLELTNIIGQNGGQVEDSLPVSTGAPYQYTGSSSETQSLIKLINDNLPKGMKALTANASADTAMSMLKQIFKTQGYDESQQRTLCGIHYGMIVKQFSYYNTYTLADGVSMDAITKIQERSANLPGTVVQQVPIRNYPDGTVAPHVIGTTGPIFAEELSKYKDQGYSADDLIGKLGIEKSMEKYLHGTNGALQVETNNTGDVASTEVITQPKPGDNVVLTIDKSLQVNLQNQLPQIIAQIKEAAVTQHTAGANAKGAAAVVLNIKTGEVLAMATYPSYDLNAYKQNYKTLNSDKTSPLLNRCIQGTYAPGSTFKPLMAVSGLMNGVITKDTYWDLPAAFQIGSGSGAWTGHDDEGKSRPNTNVIKALEVSSNIFFFRLGTTLGITKIDATAKALGIGQKTGIELSENAGQVSSPEEKKARGLPWYPADTAQTSIGQLDTLISPMQLANYVSTLVKGGTRYQVHVVKQVNSYDNTKVIVNNSTPTVVSKLDIPSTVVDTVKQGMLAVTEGNEGTAKQVFGNFNMQIGGKTGTAQITKTSFNGVFICFAPYDDPEIAIATVVEYGHNGFQTAPAAKSAIQQYFGLDANGNLVTGKAAAQQLGTLLQ